MSLLEAKKKGLKNIEISLDFYKQLFRVLKKNGKLYHYTGSPGNKNRKIDLAKNVAEKLRTAGFKDIQKAHYGLTERK